jgi:hypothetical protein
MVGVIHHAVQYRVARPHPAVADREILAVGADFLHLLHFRPAPGLIGRLHICPKNVLDAPILPPLAVDYVADPRLEVPERLSVFQGLPQGLFDGRDGVMLGEAGHIKSPQAGGFVHFFDFRPGQAGFPGPKGYGRFRLYRRGYNLRFRQIKRAIRHYLKSLIL